ncbi:helix-hairpin-helix domain-containing protein [Thermoanaerobacter brockii subsp. lactiethylicus]|jgi:competence protein ComEA|uniref:Competence protein ComEA helix-hairpin-helix repeat protein n=2 Tax=Thermoanaerobacter TaxID=1754 RepID=B0KAA8_THEP3|nr:MULTISPECIES: helix-hairpin-helix domain-containing protein [Thermoanaerobacter]KUJ90767.1 MAG: competence protein ComEA helix-hairpin-helix repeat-containing protein [Thermoanaerobacter thermocopriae]ABY93376.1 competence protein ComEA helix-hairpin-helix repeat protein [Thermoanaerobacter sp. X514]ABY95071.1 competence protein ComEA helix-hairpin-helix repeat protein [Thermoanaerobacter pseudethanolicus ATCC 33223]ADV80022.1 competence protein ComEA helix-hairpin-helix repeat protein [Ther
MTYFSKRQQYAIVVLLSFILLFSGYVIYKNYKLKNDFVISTNADDISEEVNNSIEENKKEPSEIKVYVTGLVKNPGVYLMEEGERVIDAINKAGGPLEEADLTNINLAQKVKDEQMIKVPKKGEEAMVSFSDTTAKDKKININTATREELQTLPGIGPVTAERIIEFRESKGPFKKIEDIVNVSRIGPKMFEQIKDKITVD